MHETQDLTNARYPLRVSANKRYLVDQNNHPFLLQGDAPWSLIVGISKEDADAYLANRSEKRFSAVLVNLIEHKFCNDPPKNFYGEAPFEKTGDFSTPNEKYFEHVDWVLKKAHERGILVLLCPIFLGVPGGDQGWYDEMVSLPLSSCLEYGRYLGKRYNGFDNIVWSIGADRNPDRDGLERLNLLALGIKEFDHRHLMTAQCLPEYSSTDIFSSGGWLDVNAAYSYGIVHRMLSSDYNHSPTMPVFLIESSYEGEHNSSQVQIRRQAYWSVLCGGFGHVFGNFAIWPFGPEFGSYFIGASTRVAAKWQDEMNSEGSTGMTHFGDLFRSRPWHKLVPDQKHTVVTSGLGEFRGLDYLAAGLSEDGKTLIAYMPSSRTIRVDLSKMKASEASAWWYDPRTGKAQDCGEFPTTGPRDFTPPGPADWVFVLDDKSSGLPPPGLSTR